MGQNSSTLVVKKRHLDEWVNFLDGSKEMVKDSREVFSHTDDNVLRGTQTSFQKDLKDFVKRTLTNSSLAVSMKDRITEKISNIASTVFMLSDLKKKEVKCASGRQAFVNGGQEMCFLLVITYVATQANSCYKFRFRITYAAYQSSLPVDHHDQETRSAEEMSDVESNRRSMHSNVSGDVLSVNSSGSATMDSARSSSVDPGGHPDSSAPISGTLFQGDSRLRSSQADVHL